MWTMKSEVFITPLRVLLGHAVDFFLQRRIKLTEISRVITRVMEQAITEPADSLDSILRADADARELASATIEVQV